MSDLTPMIEERNAQLSESEISILLSDLRRAYQVIKEVSPTIRKALEISDLSPDGLTTLTLDLETAIVDLEG